MSYDFSQLSSLDFEDLCRDLLQQEDGVRYELFKSGRDQGVDARHLNGDQKTIVQCKHYLRSGLDKLCRILKNEEARKVEKLRPNRYILMTSVSLSINDKQKIQTALSPFIKTQSDIFGQEDINNLLKRHPSVERQHFKLWLNSATVLERILHNDVFTLSDQLLERARRKIPFYVQNESFFDAVKILEKHRIVIVSGEPGIGKTTLAEMLILAHVRKGFQAFEVRNPRDAYRVYNSNQKCIYYFDDFLGLTYLGDTHYVEKLEDTLNLIDLIKNSRNSRIVLTSREYIISQALNYYERFCNLECLNVKYKLSLAAYTITARARILYNHLYFSDLNSEYIEELVESKKYQEIVRHENYKPRIISWLTQASRLNGISEAEYPIYFLKKLRNPKEIWEHAFKYVSTSAQNILLVVFSFGSDCEGALLQEASKSFLEHVCVKHGSHRNYDEYYYAINELIGSFLKVERNRISFYDPSVKDFLGEYISHRIEIFEDLLASSINLRQIFEIWEFLKSPNKLGLELPNFYFMDSVEKLRIRIYSSPKSRAKSLVLDAVELSYTRAITFLIEMYEIGKTQELMSIISWEIEQAKNLSKRVRGGLIEWSYIAKRINNLVENHDFSDEVLILLDDLFIYDVSKSVSLHEFFCVVSVSGNNILPSFDKEFCDLLLQEILERGDFMQEATSINNSNDLEEFLSDILELKAEIGFDDAPLIKYISKKVEEVRNHEDFLAEGAYEMYKDEHGFIEEDSYTADKEMSEKEIEESIESMFINLLDS